MLAFNYSRYQQEGTRADIAPKVGSVELAPIDVQGLKCLSVDAATVARTECLVHENCRGHLQTASNGIILLPGMCLTEDPDYVDARTRATNDVITKHMSAVDYGKAIRETMKGKRGIVRYKMMASQPIASVRGVATCVWDCHVHEIYMPRSWMTRMKVPFRQCDGDLLSEQFGFREARDGDRALLSRCPIVSQNSIQPVRIRGWDNACIGVHPEMCSPLNLDFDGDEVHVSMVSSPESVREVDVLIEQSNLCAFKAMGRVPEMTDVDEDEDLSHDPMVGTTVALDDLDSVSYTGPEFKMARCKEATRAGMVELVKQGPPKAAAELLQLAAESSYRSTLSYLNVPNSYVLARKLALVASTVELQNGLPYATWDSDSWVTTSVAAPLPATLESGCYGMPAVRASMSMTQALTQSYLDMAKKAVVSADDTLLFGLVSGGFRSKCYVTACADELRYSTRPPVPSSGDVVLATTDPKHAWSLGDHPFAFKSYCILVALACKRIGYNATNSEISCLAALMTSAAYHDREYELSSESDNQFLTKTACDRLVASAADDLRALDNALTSQGVQQGVIVKSDVRAACSAVMLGNMAAQFSKSIALVPRSAEFK